MYNRYNLEATFKKYLTAENISHQTIKQYLSDYRHFIDWCAFQSSSLGHNKAINFINLDVLPFFTTENMHEYRQYLLQAQAPHKTVNRRLSTLRKLSSFLCSEKSIVENPMTDVVNISDESTVSTSGMLDNIITDYAKTINLPQQQKATEVNTVKDFLSFINSN